MIGTGIHAIRKGIALPDTLQLVYAAVVVNDINPAARVTGETLSSDGVTFCVNASSAVTPFTSVVNVGPADQGAAWLDTARRSSVHRANSTSRKGVAKPRSPWALRRR